MNISACRSALESFAAKRVMVVGDLMLDEHIWGTVERISPEAPVMVVNAESTDFLPGGAANVASNIRALGAQALVVGAIGNDEGGRLLRDRLDSMGLDVAGVFEAPDRPTTRKTRIWASHRHQVVRVDWESRRKIPLSVARRVMDFVRREVAGVDAVLVSDYDKGVVTKETTASAIEAAAAAGLICVSNPKPCNLHHFAGIDVITLNQSEASAASAIDIDDAADVEKAARKLMQAARCRGLVVTRGAHGLSTFDGDGVCHIPALETEVYDVAGAGDTVVSALTLALACGLDLASAGAIANCAGGAVVRKVGVATTSTEEISSLLGRLEYGG